ncbi:MAG: valine--tRNA ligase [Eggerthellaceae bacterium]|nr:valine--tRNA ligase [Eggerthellaceae bacterium]
MAEASAQKESYSEWETPIFQAWKDGGYFLRTPGFGEHADESYTIVIPPPNVTGVLHMGHALNDSIQDACIRRARMQGYQTRWILGTDHAGIATQTKVDKHLAEQGINRREIGREAFIGECQKWRMEYGNTIVGQIKAMGCSCDYDHEQFTMSPEFSLAVRRLFVDWYHNDVIYRGKRIVNWCPHCTTAIADDEAEYEDEAGHLWYIRYPLEEPASGREYVVVATTRPETMLGDTGVAVSPSDERYADLVGKNVVLPIVGRKIPIFTDFHVDAEYGTGAVKVTPAHDPNDFAMGGRAGLDVENIFDETAHVVEGYGKYTGMSRDEARAAVIEELEGLGLLDHIEDISHSVMHCYRCHNTLEPWLSEQWFVNVSSLKGPARKAVESGQVKFHPDRWAQVYLDWLENLKDWCISRQLWWGHRIPVFYCDECGWQDALLEDVEVCPVCGAPVRQDEDVLDTWFSSQLWPFATQGWGELGKDAPELQAHYPTQVLSTARDIMGLWVARMVMASEYCMGQIPFQDVIIHPTVMGTDGKPMSKSRGNGIDPMDLMRDYGADGMRFGLISQVTGSQAMRFDYQRIEAARNFANKIRNAARFVAMNMDGFTPGEVSLATDADKWLFSRLAKVAAQVDEAYDAFEFSDMTRALLSFVWNEFCDWYIEFSKGRLKSDDAEDRLICQRNLNFALYAILRLMHPVMPFITEELYAQMPKDADSPDMLICAPWVDASELAKFADDEAETKIGAVISIVGAVRSTRARYGVSPKEPLAVAVKASGKLAEQVMASEALICSLANVKELSAAEDAAKGAEDAVVVLPDMEVYIGLQGFVDFQEERAKLEREQAKVTKDLEKLNKKLSNPGFLAKAAQEIIDKDTAKRDDLAVQLEKIQAQLAQI